MSTHTAPEESLSERSDPIVALLRVLYEQFPVIALGNSVLATANLVAYAGKLPTSGLVAYAAGVLSVIAVRLFLFFRYRRVPIPKQSERAHFALIQLISLINGLVWGAWSWYVATSLPAADLLAMVVVQAGICAGVVSTSSASRLGLSLFVTAALLPLSVQQFLQGGSDGVAISLVILLYLVLVMISSQRIYQTLYNSVELAHRNKQLAERLYDFSNTDGLTGIANRRQLDSSLEKMTSLYNRHAMEFALLLIDVDDFKLFNDTRGHLAGDACLKNIARTAETVFSRKEDVVARFGGEEFVVLLPGVNGDEAVQVAEEFRQSVFDLNLAHEKSTTDSRVTVSIGVAKSYDQGGLEPADLIEKADQALYTAKHKGKNRTEFVAGA